MDTKQFQVLLHEQGRQHWRNMPWRDDTRPYYVLVSELMLQQTQVGRVIPKFEAFITQFPDERALATASLADVLKLWQGLGYNRRAKYLHDAARMIVDQFGGVFPQTETELLRLPGVGTNTAGAICAYAFNQFSLFIETNIRTVYIHHFFEDRTSVSDREIIAKLEATLDRHNPRQFYQNLMDYGTYLKSQGVKTNAKSRHYTKQPPLKGSIREVRGQIIAALTNGPMSDDLLRQAVAADRRYDGALMGLIEDGLVAKSLDILSLCR